MNRQLFRLVFNARLGIFVPVHEAARARSKKAGARSGVAALLAAVWPAMPVLAQLPVPCGGGPCGSNPNPTAFVTSGTASYAAQGAQATVTQTTSKAVLNWASMNLGAGHTLTYAFQDAAGNLPAGASFATLNRIWQGSPSEIAGRIQVQPGQNGQLTFINQNGILFKDGAQINVGSLTASTFDIADELFLAGIHTNTNAGGMAAFAGGTPGGLVRVEAGARLKTERGGRVMLFAENVENHGLIETPEGQTILAAGAKIYLAVSDDPGLRGFLVEVDSPAMGGTATNSGIVIAERGNISMAGLTVNQTGRVTATTSVNLNGSIRLMARDSVTAQQRGNDPAVTLPVAQRTGQLNFGVGSITEVRPEKDDAKTMTDEQVFTPSSIEGVGRVIHVQQGSLIQAQGGNIGLEARVGAVFQAAGAPKEATARIQVDAGALLDTSGLREVSVPVERNYLQVELRGAQLQDSPLQRNSFLYKSKVWVDVEQGTPLANVRPELAKLERMVAEKSATAGNISLRSEGDLVLQAGATLDVSGGSLAYQEGYGKTSKLALNGRIVDIGQADPEQIYDGFADQYSVTDPKWGVTRAWDFVQPTFISAYTAGRPAGQISLTAHHMVADATLRGNSTAGARQRQTAPAAGGLNLTLLAETGIPFHATPDLGFVEERQQHAQTALADPLPANLTLSAALLKQGGFGRLNVATEGVIHLPEAVTLDVGANGSVRLTGRRLDIEGHILAPAGNINLTTRAGRPQESLDARDYGLNIGSRATLDVAGRWVNDLPTAGPPAGIGVVAIKGGSIGLSSHADLDIAPGSVLDASGGAWLKIDGKVSYGAAGSISLATGGFGQLSAADPMTTSLMLGGELRAYDALKQGGSLNLRVSSLHLGANPAGSAGELVLNEAFFSQGGFREFNLTGVDGVVLADGFRLVPTPVGMELKADARLHASGTRMASLTQAVSWDGDLRAPAQVGLSAESFSHGNVQVGEGAQIVVDPRGVIALTAKRQLTVLGTLAAPAGRISLQQIELQDGEKDVANFDTGRSIFLGARSRLLAEGYYRAEPNILGLRRGQVLAGGSVEVNAANGYLVAQAGSLIDVSGTQTTLDVPGRTSLVPTPVASNGGRIHLAAREGMLLEGDLRGVAGGAQALGGSLSLRLDRQGPEWFFHSTSHPLYTALNSQRVITLQADPTTLSAGMRPGDPVHVLSPNGEARLAASQVAAGGFADLSLEAENRIAFAGSLNLDLTGRLGLLAANLSAVGPASARLSAASILLGNPVAARQDESRRNDASGGPGSLELHAGLVDLVGHSNLQGFGNLSLASRGDIRLRGVVFDADLGPQPDQVDYVYRGALATGGNLSLSARQIYPVSMAEFSLEVHNNPAGQINIAATGSPGPVLSAGGRLSLAAPYIHQAGVLKAPFGTLDLRSQTITRVTGAFAVSGLPDQPSAISSSRVRPPGGLVNLAAGSLTSVSAEGQVIPLGATELAGADWIYNFGIFKKVLATLPEKRISLDGDRVALAAGARLDLSGGGDLYAHEFLSGPGGSRDILLPENNQGYYAVMPALASGAYDHQTYLGLEGWHPGSSVKLLEGAHGLAAGTYPLLPARYALLPGAWLLRLRQADSDLLPGQGGSLANGAALVAGHLGTRTADGDITHGARTATLEVRPGSAARQYSEYLNSYAGRSFAGQAGTQLPGDAGRLSMQVGSQLILQGQLLAGFGAGGRGPEVDVSAERLAITGTGTPYGAGYVTLGADQLSGLGAASLLLGGTRQVAGDGQRVNVTQHSDEVVVANDADHALHAPELILVAKDRVAVQGGAVLAAFGQPTGLSRDLHVSDAQGNGDGALLRISIGEQIALSRALGTQSRGVLDVAASATVQAGKSAILDATQDNRAVGAVILPAQGGALTLGATRIALAENGTVAATGGLVFDQTRLAALGNPESLVLRSYTTLDLYGQVDLGGQGLSFLGIEAAGLAGHGGAGQTATLRADTVRLGNPDGIDPVTAFAGTTGQGQLRVVAQQVELGKGDFRTRGFDTVNLRASGQILGLGGTLLAEAGGGAAGHLMLEAGRISTAAAADQVIRADGDLVTLLPATPAALAAATLGGKLELAGASLSHGGRVEMPGGVVTLRASSGDLTLTNGGAVLANGITLPFADIRAHAPGGSVSLVAEAGRIEAQAGSLLDVAGEATGGDAGRLQLWAAGDVNLSGTLLGDAANGFTSGHFQLTANRINPDVLGRNDFSALNSHLQAGGFHASRNIRLRQGDIEIAPGDWLRAGEIRLSADQGAIRVAGTLDADGAKGGRIELFAGGDLDLLTGALVRARATEVQASAWGTAGEGGRVLLGSGEHGQLGIAAGATVDVSVPPGSQARPGRVVLRAARTGPGAGSGVALATLAGQILGAERVEVEAYKVYADITELITGATTGSKLGIATVQAENNAFATAINVAALRGSLDTGGAGFHLLPGVEARNVNGDITLAADWNLYPLRHNGEAGVLTVRAAGNLDIAANLSDGFNSAASTGVLQSSTTTWSYRLAAGAEIGAADPLATQWGTSTGHLSIAADRLIRTGSGQIEAAARGDVRLAGGAALYTAGYATPAVANFSITGLAGSAFPDGGGDVRVQAGGGVVSTTGPNGLLTDWLYRQGNTATSSSVLFRSPGWWPQIGQFKNGIAALGGGDVRIDAGGAIANLLAATVTNARQPAIFGQDVNAAAQVIFGGGDLEVRAAGDILGGVFHVDRGMARIVTEASVGTGLARVNQQVGTVLALGDAEMTLLARRSLTLESAISPTLVPQVSGNLSGAGGANRESYFANYSPRSAVRLSSIAGDILLKNDLSALTGLSGIYGLNSTFSTGLGLYPGTLEVVAMEGDVRLANGMTLMPAPQGDLRVLAGNSVEKRGGTPIHLADYAPSRVPGLATAIRAISGITALTTLPERESDLFGPSPLHLHDPVPAHIVARRGNIVGQPSPAVFAILAKPAIYQAGQDIVNVTSLGQNLRDRDVSRYLAGRDILFATGRDPVSGIIDSNNAARISLGGPGRLDLIAGRHVDLGTSQGVTTRGNLTNPALPEGGADVLVLAGALAWDAQGRAQDIPPALLDAQALAGFFAELLASARESLATKDYSRGEAAIAALFPTQTPSGPLAYAGNLSLFFSQIKTEQGGGIRILAPGGGVNAGLASVTGFQREASRLGIMTVQGGDIQSYVLNNFEVNSSRVFTIQGGDILIWSAHGNIDAGKGAKGVTATPPPVLRMDQNGNFVLDVSQSIAGSGIQAIKPGSNAALVAPRGEVNAGDAGIRVGGDLLVVAERVVGSDNIQVGGISTGVPVTDAGGLAGSLAGVGTLTDNSKEATRAVAGNAVKEDDRRQAEAARQVLAAFKPSFINVEVLGFGEGAAGIGDAAPPTERRPRDEERSRPGTRGG